MTCPSDPDLVDVFRQMYAATREMRELHRAGLGPLYDLAFKIMHAPPRRHPPVLFIGIQPGGDKADMASCEMFRWPHRFDYETGGWRLATYIRDLFKDYRDLMMTCNATNANFFRAQPSNKKKPDQLHWRCACVSSRTALEDFCETQLKIIVEQLQPKTIVVTGDVLRQPNLWQSKLPAWNEEGSVFGIRAVRVMHTAAHLTSEARAARDAAIRKIAGL
jgi:hypothetical protein